MTAPAFENVAAVLPPDRVQIIRRWARDQDEVYGTATTAEILEAFADGDTIGTLVRHTMAGNNLTVIDRNAVPRPYVTAALAAQAIYEDATDNKRTDGRRGVALPRFYPALDVAARAATLEVVPDA